MLTKLQWKFKHCYTLQPSRFLPCFNKFPPTSMNSYQPKAHRKHFLFLAITTITTRGKDPHNMGACILSMPMNCYLNTWWNNLHWKDNERHLPKDMTWHLYLIHNHTSIIDETICKKAWVRKGSTSNRTMIRSNHATIPFHLLHFVIWWSPWCSLKQPFQWILYNYAFSFSYMTLRRHEHMMINISTTS